MGKGSKKRQQRTGSAHPRHPLRTPSRGARYGAALMFLLAAALAGAWLARRGSGPREARQAPPPGALKGHNLLVITIDTLRADHLGCYDSTKGTTPHLDRFAAQGIRFDNVLAHVPLTLPSHTSIFTSRYPVEHGVHDNGTFRVGRSVPTLATVLKAAGYHTGAFVGAFVLDARFGLNRGFDIYDDYYGEKRAFLSFMQLERRAGAVVASAERWIRQEARSPWFAWVHVFDPHAPYEAPPAFQERFPGDPYGAEVAYVDEVVGSFLERLEAAGRLEGVLVSVLGDHGESLGEHGERTHGTFAYDSTLRVPWLMWAGPRLRPQVFAKRVRHVDFMPTVLDLLGVSVPEGMAGQSLRHYLNGERPYEPPATYFEALNVHFTRDWAPLRGVVEDGYKLIQLPVPELYDLVHDPEEKHNIYQREPELAHRLEQTLKDLSGGAGTVAPELPDLETVERLRALGYVTAPVSEHKEEYTEADDPKRLIGISNAYDDAADLFARGQTGQALAVLRDLLEKQPRSSQAYQGLAYALHQMGRVDEAIGVLEGGVKNGVKEMSLLGMLGAYLLEVGSVEKAMGLLEELVREHPNYAEGHNYLGVAYGRMGRQGQARRQFEKVLELDPSSASTYNNLGSLALSRGDWDEAVRYLEQALRYDPQYATAHNGLGVAHARKGEMEAAVSSWKRAVELDSTQFDALYNLAIALVESSPQEAVGYLERFANEAPPRRYQADIARARALIRRIESSGR